MKRCSTRTHQLRICSKLSPMPAMPRRAAVIGAGPNGLAAAIPTAQAGLHVDVFEAEAQPGGAARSMELTLPGFLHDFGSAVHPMAAGSPFFSSLPLRDHGLEWIHPPAPLAHPLDDGTAVMLERDLGAAEAALGEDGKQWRRLMGPFAQRWAELAPEVLRPVHLFTRHPVLMAHLGLVGFPSAIAIAEGNPTSPKCAIRTGCRVNKWTGRSTSGASSAQCSANRPISLRHCLPSSPSAASAAPRSRSNITAVPSS